MLIDGCSFLACHISSRFTSPSIKKEDNKQANKMKYGERIEAGLRRERKFIF